VSWVSGKTAILCSRRGGERGLCQRSSFWKCRTSECRVKSKRHGTTTTTTPAQRENRKVIMQREERGSQALRRVAAKARLCAPSTTIRNARTKRPLPLARHHSVAISLTISQSGLTDSWPSVYSINCPILLAQFPTNRGCVLLLLLMFTDTIRALFLGRQHDFVTLLLEPHSPVCLLSSPG
jgi:hypothetical protein